MDKKVIIVYHKKKRILQLMAIHLLFTICLNLCNTGYVRAEMADQGKTLRGIVKGVDGKPLPGVNVVIKGTLYGVATDSDGKYTLSVDGKNSSLVFSFIGYVAQEVPVVAKITIDIILLEDLKELDEVVIVGYGKQKKVTVTGAVSSIGTSQLISAPVANISNSLAGRVPGLLVLQPNGAPGYDQSTIRIRGTSTFKGSADPLILVDGIESTSYNGIDPNEIENLSVLKDASATAVYGVRGANGVILITTKRGNIGKPQISFTGNFAMSKFSEFKELMNGYTFANRYQESMKYDSYLTGNFTPLFTDTDLQLYKDGSDPIWHPSVDWQKLLFKPASLQQQYNLNIRGGTEKVKYFVSGGYFNQGGSYNNTNLVSDFYDSQLRFKRYNIRTNFDFTITKRLTFIVNLSSQFEERNGVDPKGVMNSLMTLNPISEPGIVNGMNVNFVNPPIGAFTNPVNQFFNFPKSYSNYLDGSFRANYNIDYITKGLSVHGIISYKNYNKQTLNFSKLWKSYFALKTTNGETVFVTKDPDQGTGITVTGDKSRMSFAEIGLDYARTIGKHSITGLFLYNQRKLFDPNLQYVIPSAYQGIVGRLAYNYMNRYLAEVDFGYNGTENFAPGKRFGFFPAYSLGWVLSDEPFFPQNNIVSFVKFRASYGEVGNDKIGGDRFLYKPNSYTYYNGAYYWGTIGSTISSYSGSSEGKIGNPNVTWERAKKKDIGIDLILLKDKLKISADIFSEIRDNILTTRSTIPWIVGGGTNLPAVNIGKMRNRGYDGEITYTGKSGNLNYSLSINCTYAKNTVLFKDEVYNPWGYLLTTNQRAGQIYGSVFNGFFNSWTEVNDAYRVKNAINNNKIQPGDPNYRDINGDGIYDTYDQAPIGYSEFPEKVFGLSGSLNYKNFDINFLLQGATNYTFDARNTYAFGGYALQYFENSWTQQKYENGEFITFPHPYGAGSRQLDYDRQSTLYCKDASFLKLKNLEVGYTLNKVNLLKRLGISSCRVYLNGSNLFTWAPGMNKMFPGVDPENTGAVSGGGEPYPRLKVFNLGFNVNF